MSKPFFGGSPAADANPRLLLISYHFPPSRQVGGLRWQKFAEWFARWGWSLDVITRDPQYLVGPDPSRLNELPPGTRVYGVGERPGLLDRIEDIGVKALKQVRQQTRRSPAPAEMKPTGAPPLASPASLSRADILASRLERRSLVRAYHAWRDFGLGWSREAAHIAKGIIQPGLHRAVITCGPPHMAHHAGCLVHDRTGLPLVLDFRDPWSLQQRLLEPVASPIWFKLAARRERFAIARAALIAVNTRPFQAAMQRRYPAAAGRIITVMNGFDRDPLPPAQPRERFVLAYAGSIYLDRNPRVLFRALRSLTDLLRLTPEQIGVEFMGDVHALDGQSLASIAAEEGVAAYVRLWPAGTRTQALTFLMAASVLVSLHQDTDMAIPSKIFEYMLFPSWILAFAQPGSATEELLRGTPAVVLPPTDVAGLAERLRQLFESFRAGVRPAPIADTMDYGRERQARLLLEHIQSLA